MSGAAWPQDLGPFRIHGPALINVSGGRTSMAMLRMVLDAHDGHLPSDVITAFADTGRELPGVRIERLERPGGFDALLDDVQASATVRGKRARLPSPNTRYCTVRLKREPAERLAVARFGDGNGRVDALTWVIGLRADEPRRLARMRLRGGERRPVYAAGNEPWTWPKDDPEAFRALCRERQIGYVDYDYEFPLAQAGWCEADVRAFWDAQPFDLGIPSAFGNCEHCMLKDGEKRLAVAIHYPERVAVWAADEARFGDRYRPDGMPPSELLAKAARLRLEAPAYCDGIGERLDRRTRHRSGVQLPVLMDEPDLGGCTLCTD